MTASVSPFLTFIPSRRTSARPGPGSWSRSSPDSAISGIPWRVSSFAASPDVIRWTRPRVTSGRERIWSYCDNRRTPRRRQKSQRDQPEQPGQEPQPAPPRRPAPASDGRDPGGIYRVGTIDLQARRVLRAACSPWITSTLRQMWKASLAGSRWNAAIGDHCENHNEVGVIASSRDQTMSDRTAVRVASSADAVSKRWRAQLARSRMARVGTARRQRRLGPPDGVDLERVDLAPLVQRLELAVVDRRPCRRA